MSERADLGAAIDLLSLKVRWIFRDRHSLRQAQLRAAGNDVVRSYIRAIRILCKAQEPKRPVDEIARTVVDTWYEGRSMRKGTLQRLIRAALQAEREG